jgi:hypothetical protein
MGEHREPEDLHAENRRLRRALDIAGAQVKRLREENARLREDRVMLSAYALTGEGPVDWMEGNRQQGCRGCGVTYLTGVDVDLAPCPRCGVVNGRRHRAAPPPLPREPA